MNDHKNNTKRLSEESVQEELQTHPHLLAALAQNALTVAESLRDNHFRKTAKFVTDLRKAIARSDEPLLNLGRVDDTDWSQVQSEVVTFIDGGFGASPISSRVPILLRVGSYSVRTGERSLAQREQFGFYPVILGDIEGGSKERHDFSSLVRFMAEALGGLAMLERTPELNVLLFHGPLVQFMGTYAGHTPFTEGDIDIFLKQYSLNAEAGRQMKEEFLREAYIDIYPQMAEEYSDEWVRLRLFEPLAWIAYLYRRIVQEAAKRIPKPIIVGVVERGRLREFSERILLDRVFRNSRLKGRSDYFNNTFARPDLTSPKAVLDKLGYNDDLLLAMLLQVGEYSEPWEMIKNKSLHRGEITLPGVVGPHMVNWKPLNTPSKIGFPAVLGSYVQVSNTTMPVRIEVFHQLGEDQVVEAVRRVYLYSQLLPGYGFPVGLHIADKYAHVPGWLLSAYSKLIKYHLGVSLQNGEISDEAMRRILIQSIYMTHRDWLFRPRD